jgi:PTH1 family peptidyl-tRNA hydrolase
MTLFVGLGNPEPRYESTRHNIGWRVIDRLVSEAGARDISKNTFHGELHRHGNLFFLKPTTYMNLSGKSVQAVTQFFKIELDDVIVIHDDIDLPFGALRFKHGGGHGGHNGLRSIDALLGQTYDRVRFGVGKPEHKTQVADYVLHDFSPEELSHLNELIDHTAQACRALLEKPFDEVRTHFSRKAIEL